MELEDDDSAEGGFREEYADGTAQAEGRPSLLSADERAGKELRCDLYLCRSGGIGVGHLQEKGW